VVFMDTRGQEGGFQAAGPGEEMMEEDDIPF
jgi:hypothetical protein